MAVRLLYTGIYAVGLALGRLVGRDATVLLALAIAASMGVSLLRRPRSVELTATGREFVVPDSLTGAVVTAALLAYSISQARWMLVNHDEFAVFRRMYFGIGVVHAILAALLVFLALYSVLRPPAFRLTPEGAGNRRLVRWDEMTEPVAVSGEHRFAQYVKLAGLKGVSAQGLGMPAEALARIVEYYRTHPEHRPAIGTAEEHDRLRTALA